MIYRINFNHADFLNLDLDLDSLADEVCESMREEDFFEFSAKNLSLESYWVDIGASFVDVGLNNNAIPDITLWNSTCLFLSPAAKAALSTAFEGLGEFLPVTVDSETYDVFNCLVKIKADPAGTRERRVDGVWQGLEKLSFKPQDVKGQLIFKTNADNGTFLYCTQAFVDLINKLRLRGLTFETDLSL